MSEKKEGPILVMAVATLDLIVVMTLYTVLYPPDFEKRAEQAEQGQIEEANSEGSDEEFELTPPDSSDVSQ